MKVTWTRPPTPEATITIELNESQAHDLLRIAERSVGVVFGASALAEALSRALVSMGSR